MKYIYIILGILSLALGIVGLILHFFPSTPFLLFSAVCFTKSSKRLDAWYKSTKLFKNNIEPLVKKEGITKNAKFRIMSSITIVFTIAAFFMRNTTVGLICLVVVWVGHIIGFGFFVKTKQDDF